MAVHLPHHGEDVTPPAAVVKPDFTPITPCTPSSGV